MASHMIPVWENSHVTLKIVTLNSRFLFSEISYKSKKSAVVRMSFVHTVSVYSADRKSVV